MRDATREIAAGKFDTRVSEKRSDELGQLGRSINKMSSRLERHVDGQSRFLGDIAHELCSPIARMQMALGVLEQRSPPELAPRVEGVREELEQMASMVNELLSFSKASLTPEAITLERVALGPLINDIARRETGGSEADIGIEESSGLEVLADKNLLGRALGNLLRNAMRYAGDAGPISINAEPDGDGQIIVRVRDRGSGIPEEALPHILEPFYRPDAARNREVGGAGLGLAIVRTCAEACGGEVDCRNADPGFEVAITLKEAS
jgi:two-component system sensor histidine kinase CpxA